jgi:hypothetical protein
MARYGAMTYTACYPTTKGIATMAAYNNRPPTCLTARREQLSKRILAGELDDVPLYICPPPVTAHPRRSPAPPRPTARAHCRNTRQDRP